MVSSVLFVTLMLMYEFMDLCFFDCQVDFDVDNVQRSELVNLYGYSAIQELLLLTTILDTVTDTCFASSSCLCTFFFLSFIMASPKCLWRHG